MGVQDASIWMVQFIKAIRDEKGYMVHNAYLIGFFRRICKLLFLRTKPIFVFDGATPALKRRTVIARLRQRENAQTNIRKTAENLMFNRGLGGKHVADSFMKYDPKGKGVMLDGDGLDNTAKSNIEQVSSLRGKDYQEKLDEMLAASLAAEEDGNFTSNEEEDEEILLPAMDGNVDPAVLASLPPSMQLDLLVQMREKLMAENRQKYQKVKKAPENFSELQIEAYLKTVAFRREINEVQRTAGGRGCWWSSNI